MSNGIGSEKEKGKSRGDVKLALVLLISYLVVVVPPMLPGPYRNSCSAIIAVMSITVMNLGVLMYAQLVASYVARMLQ